jgi:diaminopimelate decarboxylase
MEIQTPPGISLPPFLQYRNGSLYMEEIPVEKILSQWGTPLYCYSLTNMQDQFQRLSSAFPGRKVVIHYAVKANSLLVILSSFASWGAGFDVVSEGEYRLCLLAGGEGEKIVFSGVGKTPREIATVLSQGIRGIHIESEEELYTIGEVCRSLQKKAPVAVRVNPDVEVDTHPHIATGHKYSKFGVPFSSAISIYREISRSDSFIPVGIATHIGSQILSVEPFRKACERIIDLLYRLEKEGISISYVDMGGGLGIPYREEDTPFPVEEYGKTLSELIPSTVEIHIEPGRYLVGQSGVLFGKVLYRKKVGGKKVYIMDTAMTELIRPALYGAHHTPVPVFFKNSVEWERVDIAGPVCESADFLARDVFLPPLEPGEYVGFLSAGAYGSVMSSTYNARLRPPEILIYRNTVCLARRRESYEDLLLRENFPHTFVPFP